MRRRQGFTLVELLVAMALIIFIMAILSQAFVSATGAFRVLKASGDMAEKLRATTQLLQRDLASDHFEGKKRLSNPNFWLNGPPQQGYFQISQLSAGTLEGTDLDGVGSFLSTGHTLAFTIKARGNQMGDQMSASVPGNLLAATSAFGPSESRYQGTSGGSYNYQWAEVAWFLQPQPDTTVADPAAINPATGFPPSPPVQLFTLFRRQRLAVPDNSLVLNPATGTPFTLSTLSPVQAVELSCWLNPPPSAANPNPPWYFNSAIDLTVPQRRFGQGNPLLFTTLANDLGGTNPTLAGADIQLNDVVSFDVRMMFSYPSSGGVDPFVNLWQFPFTAPLDAPPPPPPPGPGILNGNGNVFWPGSLPPPTDALPHGGAMIFDTWSSVKDSLSDYSQWNVFGHGSSGTSIPLWNGTSGPIIQAIQIQIRIWDAKTNQTRQVTIVQAM